MPQVDTPWDIIRQIKLEDVGADKDEDTEPEEEPDTNQETPTEGE